MKKHQLLLLLLGCFMAAKPAHCAIPSTFHYVFGTNNTTDQRVKRMKADTFFDSPLQIEFAEAVARSNTNQMQRLLARGADVNCQGHRGMRPLFWALINQSIPGVRFLLDYGADPNAKVTAKQPPADNALSLAAYLEEPQILEELLKHGANPNGPVTQWRKTALFTAAFYNQHKHISILLANGANINWECSNGDTALHAAIRQSAYATALFLYRAGANPLIKTSYGDNSIDSLKQFGGRLILKRSDKAPYKQLCAELIKAGLLNESDVR